MTSSMLPSFPPKDLFITAMRRAPSLEELIAMMDRRPIDVPADDDVVDAWIGLQRAFMRRRIQQIKTPEDVLATHNYFKGLNLYVLEIQRELGFMANHVFSKWTPDNSAFRKGASSTK